MRGVTSVTKSCGWSNDRSGSDSDHRWSHLGSRRRRPWGAALVLFSVIVSGLLAMNLFEPVAGWMETSPCTYEWQNRWDINCLLESFRSVQRLGLREATDRIMPTHWMSRVWSMRFAGCWAWPPATSWLQSS